ncbi:hypothetical protein ACLK1S_25930 [Escherichia coli]
MQTVWAPTPWRNWWSSAVWPVNKPTERAATAGNGNEAAMKRRQLALNNV